MSRARQKHDWSVGSEIVASVLNTVRDVKARKKPFTGDDFNPFVKKAKPIKEIVTISELKKRMGM